MNIAQAKELVIAVITEALKGEVEIKDDTPLIGGVSSFDSVKLVEICLTLEDLANEHGFEFDWTAESTMSKSHSMFRSVAALAEEFASQSEVK